MYCIILYQDEISYHFQQINYEWNFCIVNVHQSLSNFCCFFRDGNGTKMTCCWKGLTVFNVFIEVDMKCDISVTGKIGRFSSIFGHLTYQKSWVWRMYVEHFVPRDVKVQLSSLTDWLVEKTVLLCRQIMFSSWPTL